MRNLAISVSLALACSSCAGVSDNAAALPSARWVAAPASTVPLLFVVTESPPWARIAEYPATGGAPIRTISKGIIGPQRFAIDPSGTVYVVNHPAFSSYAVAEYDAGKTAVARTLTKEVETPGSVAVDASSNFYFLNGTGPLVKYARRATRPSYAVGHGLCRRGAGNSAVTADGSGDAFVFERCSSSHPYGLIREYDAGGALYRSIVLPNLTTFVTADASGRLYVEFFSGGAISVDEYAPGQTTPAQTLRFGPVIKKTGLLEVFAPTIDEVTGELLTTLMACLRTGCNSWVYVFGPGATKPNLTIDFGSDELLGPPHAGADGTLYVETFDPTIRKERISAYPHGSTTAKTILQGPNLGGLLFVWPNAEKTTTATPSASVHATLGVTASGVPWVRWHHGQEALLHR